MKKFRRGLLALALLAAIAFTIFWFARPRDVSFDALRAGVPNSQYSRFAEIDGVRLHYQETGSGPPLLLIHGYTSSTYTWKDVFAPLSAKYRVIAVDLKGFGFSDKPAGDYTRRAQAILVVHLLDYLQIEQATLVGNSLGGEVALNCAILYPQRISRLILLDSAGLPQPPGAATLSPAAASWPVVGPVLTALALTSDKLVRQGLQKSFADPSQVTDGHVAYYYRFLQTRDGQRAAYLTRVQAGQFPVAPELAKIRQPTLLIWGAHDRIIPLASGQRFNELINGSRLIILPDGGHVPQEEMPARIVQEIMAFAT